MNQLVSAVAQSYEEREELENPFDNATDHERHERFKEGWYTGYVATSVVSLVYGGEVLKTVTTSAEFAVVTARVSEMGQSALTVLKSAGWVYKGTKKVMWPARLRLLYCSNPVVLVCQGLGYVSEKAFREAFFSKLKVVGVQVKAAKSYNRLSSTAKVALGDHPARLGEFLSSTGEWGVAFLNRHDGNGGVLRNLFDYADGLSDNRFLRDLARSDVDVESFVTTTDGPVARIVKNTPNGEIVSTVKFVEKGKKLEFIEKVADDTAGQKSRFEFSDKR